MTGSRLASRAATAVAVMSAMGALLTAQQSAAQEFNMSLIAGATHSDNVQRVSTDEQEDTTIDAGLRLQIERDGPRLDADVSADLRYSSYLDDTFEDEFFGGLDASVVYAFIPDRFTWTIQNNFGQTLLDRSLVETPDNRQNTNYFSTGPDLLIPFGGRTLMTIQGRWADASFETSEDADNQRYSGSVGLARALGETSSVSLTVTAEQVEYDDTLVDSDYDSQSAYLGYEAAGARTTLSVEAGYTQLDGLGGTIDGPLFNLAVTRQVSPRSTLEFNAGTNLTDTAQVFARDQGIGGVGPDSEVVIVTRDPLQADYASLAWTVEGARNALALTLDWRQDDQQQEQQFDRERLGGAVVLSRQMSRRLQGRIYGAYATEEYDNTGVDFDEWSVGVGFDMTLSPSFAVALRFDRLEGTGSSTSGPDTRDYVENRASLAFSYTPGR